MKRIAIEELTTRVKDLLATTPKEEVLLTRGGMPFAFVTDASNYDWEDIGYMIDPEFWKMIEERRRDKRPGIPLEVVEAELEELERAEARRTGTHKLRNGKKKKAG